MLSTNSVAPYVRIATDWGWPRIGPARVAANDRGSTRKFSIFHQGTLRQRNLDLVPLRNLGNIISLQATRRYWQKPRNVLHLNKLMYAFIAYFVWGPFDFRHVSNSSILASSQDTRSR
jgi:hypothetical protein